MKSIKQEMHEKLIGKPLFLQVNGKVNMEIYKKVLTISDRIFNEIGWKIEAIYNDKITNFSRNN